MTNTCKILITALIFQFCLLCIFCPLSAQTSEQPTALVMVQKGTKTSTYQGEKLSFYIKLLSGTWFSGSPRFDLPDMKEGLLYKVQDSPVQGTESRNGQTFTTQLYEFWFFPKQSGKITIPEINVSFSTSIPSGGDPVRHNLATQPFQVSIQGIPGLPPDETIITTTQFDITQNWQPEPSNGLTGDAFTRTIKMRAKDMASIFLPEITFSPVPGIAIYPQPATVSDFNERGEATGERTESATYLFEKEGTYSIPDIEIHWWNSNTKKLEKTLLSGFEGVTIRPNPNASQQQKSHPEKVNSHILIWILAATGIIALCCILLIKYFSSLKQFYRDQVELYRQSEYASFARFKKSCKKNQQNAAYNSLYFWVLKNTSRRNLTLQQFEMESGKQELSEEITALENLLFQPQESSRKTWRGTKLYKLIAAIRKRGKAGKKDHRALPQSLNF